MKIKINFEGKEREVVISGLNAEHKLDFVRKIADLAKKSKVDKLEAIGEMEEFLVYQDDLAIEVTDLTEEEFKKMDLEESNKILLAIRNVLFAGSERAGLF